MSLWYDDFEFQKLKPVRIEEISRYLFGFLSCGSPKAVIFLNTGFRVRGFGS